MRTAEALAPVIPPPRVRLAQQLAVLTGGLLLFPTAILLLATVGFLFGISLGAWVVPLAAAFTVLGLRALCSSWAQIARSAGLLLVVHAAAGAASIFVFDGSWDGLAYHQEAILRLAAGWNPIHEDARAYGRFYELYINHYPKTTWISSAAILLATGHIEAGKLFNLTLALAAFAQVAATLLHVTSLRIPIAVGLAVLAAANPIVVSQVTTFYVDGILASLLAVLVGAIVLHATTARWQPLAIAVLAGVLAINVKLTGVGYVPALLGAGILVIAWQRGARATAPLISASLAAGVVGVLVVGYDPYVQNFLEHGHPMHPVMGAQAHLVDTTSMTPVNLRDRDRLSRFLISNFSETDIVRPPRGTRLKFPFWVGPGEMRGVYNFGTETGGFGPLFGAMLISAAAGGILLVSAPAMRTSGIAVLVISAALMGSVMLLAETWWARYVPQAWLIPMVVTAAAFTAPRRSVVRYVGGAMVVLAVANLAVITVNIAWRQYVYNRATAGALQQMRAAPQPVTVYMDGFTSLRQRLREADIDFLAVDTPPDVEPARRHTIPVPAGLAFWVQ